MKFLKTAELEEQVLKRFFQEKWDELEDRSTLKEYGYLVDFQGDYRSFFALVPVDKTSLWLKSLYMKEGIPAYYPLAMIESTINLAKEAGATSLFIHSHQDTLNILLYLLQFEEENKVSFVDNQATSPGSWWKKDLGRSNVMM